MHGHLNVKYECMFWCLFDTKKKNSNFRKYLREISLETASRYSGPEYDQLADFLEHDYELEECGVAE
jgi:hypothetical protein